MLNYSRLLDVKPWSPVLSVYKIINTQTCFFRLAQENILKALIFAFQLIASACILTELL